MDPLPSRSLHIAILHNNDFEQFAGDAPARVAAADVEQAARGIARVLAERGHTPRIVTVDAGDLLETVAELMHAPPDLVFNLCESIAGEACHEPLVPALLDLVGLPYTGSGPAALGLALRKDRTKDILRARGIPTPEAVCLDRPPSADLGIGFPLIVKPAREDASVGISNDSVVHDQRALADVVCHVIEEFHQPALVERYVEGREIYASLLGNAPPTVLPLHEIDFTSLPCGLPRIVSYDAKWSPDSPEFAGTRPIRCELADSTRAAVERVAREAFAALELRDYARIDFRLTAEGVPLVIDVNPNCDLSDGAGFSRAAGYGGLDYPALIERVVETAWERSRHATPPRSELRRPRLLRNAGDPPALVGRSSGAGGARRANRAVHLR